MKFENVVVRAVELKHLQGIGKKSAQPYNFHALVIVDEVYNRFETTIGKDDLVDGVIPNWLLDAVENKNEIIVDASFTMRDNIIRLSIDNIRPQN